MRVLAADTLAYLIEVYMASHIEIIASIFVQSEFKLFVQVSADLQRVAAISNHLISTMASYLRWEPEPPQVMKVCSSFIGRPYRFQFNELALPQIYVANCHWQLICWFWSLTLVGDQLPILYAVCSFVKITQDPVASAVIAYSSNDL